MSPRDAVAAVRQVFALLEAMGHQGPAALPELSARTGLAGHAAQRLLQTMAGLGYVTRQDGRWRLSIHTFELGARAQQLPELVEAARPVMRAVALASGEAVQLGAAQEGEVVCLHKIDSAQPLGLSLPVGQRLPLCGSALGQALLAWSDPVAAQDGELARIRQRGFCEQRAAHVHSLAVPILDRHGLAIAGLALHVPVVRFDAVRGGQLAERLRAAGSSVSQALGWVA